MRAGAVQERKEGGRTGAVVKARPWRWSEAGAGKSDKGSRNAKMGEV